MFQRRYQSTASVQSSQLKNNSFANVLAYWTRFLKNTPHSCPPKQAGIHSAIFLDVLIQILR